MTAADLAARIAVGVLIGVLAALGAIALHGTGQPGCPAYLPDCTYPTATTGAP